MASPAELARRAAEARAAREAAGKPPENDRPADAPRETSSSKRDNNDTDRAAGAEQNAAAPGRSAERDALHRELLKRWHGRWTSDELASLHAVQSIWERSRTIDPVMTAAVLRAAATKYQAPFLMDFMARTGKEIVCSILDRPADLSPRGRELLVVHADIIESAAWWTAKVLAERDLSWELEDLLIKFVSRATPFYRTPWLTIIEATLDPACAADETEIPIPNKQNGATAAAASGKVPQKADAAEHETEGPSLICLRAVSESFPWKVRSKVCRIFDEETLAKNPLPRRSNTPASKRMYGIVSAVEPAASRAKDFSCYQTDRTQVHNHSVHPLPKGSLIKLRMLNDKFACRGVDNVSLHSIAKALAPLRDASPFSTHEIRTFMDRWAEAVVATCFQPQNPFKSLADIESVIQTTTLYLIDELWHQGQLRHFRLLARLLSLEGATGDLALYMRHPLEMYNTISWVVRSGLFYLIDQMLCGKVPLYDDNGKAVDVQSEEMQRLLLEPVYACSDELAFTPERRRIYNPRRRAIPANGFSPYRPPYQPPYPPPSRSRAQRVVRLLKGLGSWR